eukprot:6200971-Pleurochrysis_carterae.AAC.4
MVAASSVLGRTCSKSSTEQHADENQNGFDATAISRSDVQSVVRRNIYILSPEKLCNSQYKG